MWAKIAPDPLLGEVEDDLLRLVDELARLADALAAEPGDLLAGANEPSQSGCLLDDAGVVLDVRSGGDQRRELGDAGGAADLLELAPLLELVRERDRVDGLALGPQREAGAVDRAVRAAVEIGGVDDLGDRADRGLGEEHRAENRLLGLEVLGWHVAQRWCVGRAHGAGSNLSRAVTSRTAHRGE